MKKLYEYSTASTSGEIQLHEYSLLGVTDDGRYEIHTSNGYLTWTRADEAERRYGETREEALLKFIANLKWSMEEKRKEISAIRRKILIDQSSLSMAQLKLEKMKK